MKLNPIELELHKDLFTFGIINLRLSKDWSSSSRHLFAIQGARRKNTNKWTIVLHFFFRFNFAPKGYVDYITNSGITC